MAKEFRLKILFSRELSEVEQAEFWDSLIVEIEKFDLRAGGGHNSIQLDWIVDYSHSSNKKSEIIEGIIDFLQVNDFMISSYKIE